MNLDIYIFFQINNLALKHLWLDTLAIFLAKYLPYLLVIVLVLFLLKDFRKYWKMVAAALSAAIFSEVITQLIRFIWYQPRPFIENQVNLLLTHSPTSSFPSGHAAFFFALSTVIFLYYKKVYPAPSRRFWCGVGIFFLIASFLIGLSRVFSGLHWPSDILAGIVLGILSAWLINKIVTLNARQR